MVESKCWEDKDTVNLKRVIREIESHAITVPVSGKHSVLSHCLKKERKEGRITGVFKAVKVYFHCLLSLFYYCPPKQDLACNKL